MTQEEKHLLFIDISARLRYGVKIIDEPAHCIGELFLISTTDMVEYETETDTGTQTIYNIKPYLRPMSSMTEEEWKEYNQTIGKSFSFTDEVDWLNAHQFDYRGLIEKGLALEASEGMYKN